MSDALPYSWSALYSKITEGVPEVNFEKLAPMCPLIAAEIALSSLSLCIYLHTKTAIQYINVFSSVLLQLQMCAVKSTDPGKFALSFKRQLAFAHTQEGHLHTYGSSILCN